MQALITLLLIAQLQHTERIEPIASNYLTPHFYLYDNGKEQSARRYVQWPY